MYRACGNLPFISRWVPGAPANDDTQYCAEASGYATLPRSAFDRTGQAQSPGTVIVARAGGADAARTSVRRIRRLRGIPPVSPPVYSTKPVEFLSSPSGAVRCATERM